MSERRERGSALMLMPAAVLVMLMLSAIAVDQAVVFLAHRRLASITSGAANDLAVTALPSDPSASEPIPIGSEVVSQLPAALDRQNVDGLRDLQCEAGTSGPQVTVRCQASVHYIFARGIPGARHFTVVRAQTTAVPTRRQPPAAP